MTAKEIVLHFYPNAIATQRESTGTWIICTKGKDIIYACGSTEDEAWEFANEKCREDFNKEMVG